MILMIDNYDSFTYNLVQYCGELGFEVKVARNDDVRGLKRADFRERNRIVARHFNLEPKFPQYWTRL